MTETAVQAFIFDMDGTLFDTERINWHTWKMVEETFGVTGGEILFRSFTGTYMPNVIDKYTEVFGSRELAQKILDFRREKREELISRADISMKAGALEALELLWGRGIPTALATSNFRERVETLFSGVKLEPRFQAMVTGDMVANGKPHPDIFLAAAERLGVPIERCAVVEDSRVGILAARASGAYSVLIPDSLAPTEEMTAAADAVLDDLHGLIEHFHLQE